MQGLRFGVLGALEVWRDGVPVPVPSGRRRAVLACLLVHAGRPVSADALLEAGWGGSLPAEPKPALHTVLSRLRLLLGDGVLRAEPAGYRLDLPADAVDARLFERLRAAASAASPEEAARFLERALGCWRGPAYAEFADREFATVEAARLDRLRLDTVEARAAVCLENGAIEDAVATSESLLAEQPFREHALRLLMTALYRAGRATDALDRYRGYRRTLAEELGLEPSPALRELESSILGHELASPVPAPEPPVWLDTSNAFVGREATLVELVEAVAVDRLVTVTGVGGVGKTRLAAQALPMLAERCVAPIGVVELAAVRVGQVDRALADALGLSPPSDAVRESVLEYLGGSNQVLVLDNCEHVLDEARSLVRLVLRQCPRVRLLATSRHRLGIESERVVPIGPLPVPDVGTLRPELTESVRLFADRVRRIQPAFGVTGDSIAAVAEVCRRLDGVPLALEMAASRAAVLGLGPVLDELDRHNNLHEVMEWSYRLLGAQQRTLFAYLSVFAGAFDLHAVQGLAAALGEWDGGRAVASPLAELMDASLLAPYDIDGTPAYRMLTVVRAFAAERLAESGEAEAAGQAHAIWVREMVQAAAVDSTGTRSRGAFARLDRNRADIDAALRWSIQAGRTRLAGAITGAVQLCQHWHPQVEVGEHVVAVARQCARDASPDSALAVAAGACALSERGETAGSRELAERALESAGSQLERFLAYRALGVVTIYSGEHKESARWWREIVAMDGLPPAYRADGHSSLALLACYGDDLSAARQEATLALAAAEAAGAVASRAFALYAAGEIAVREDMSEGARLLGEAAAEAEQASVAQVSQVARLARLAALVRLHRCEESLELAPTLLRDARRAWTWPQLWTTMRIVAELLDSVNQPEGAAFLFTAARAAESAPPIMGADVPRYEKLAERLSERLGADFVDRIGALASSLPRTQVLDRAVALVETCAPAPGYRVCSERRQ